MNDDVRKLFESIGTPKLEYREVAAVERWQAAAQRWPLLAQTNKQLHDQRLTQVPREVTPRGRAGRCTTIAVVSLAGGTGRTTLAANLAATLGQNGRAVVAADLDPQNALGLHFGLDSSDPFGLFTPNVGPQEVSLWFQRFRSAAAVLPFGALTGAAIAGLEGASAREPQWLQKRLAAFVPNETEFLVLDTPARASPWLKQALAIADAVLVVLTPDAAGYATLPATEALLDEWMTGAQGRRRARYLVNKFDARRALDRDVLASLRGVISDRALARAVHADEVVAEALARRRLVVREGPESQVVAELSNLAEWIETSAAAMRTAGAPTLVVAGAR